MPSTRPLSPLLCLLALLAGVLAVAAHPASASAAGIAQTRVGGSDQISALCTGVSAADIGGGQRGNTPSYDGKAVGDLFATDPNAPTTQGPTDEISTVPGHPFTGPTAPKAAFTHLEQYHGLDPKVAGNRLHHLKEQGGLGPADDVDIGRTGDVYNACTGEHLGTLTDPNLPKDR